MEINLDIVEIERRIEELPYGMRVTVRKMKEQVSFIVDGRVEPISELVLALALYEVLKSK